MDPALRIIDANVNRASEGLRVLEDIARFARDHAPGAAAVKDLRHRLREAIHAAGLTRTELAQHRDTPGDVGTEIATDAEQDRASLTQLAEAAGARAAEALRAIEEAMKLKALDARAVETIRYATYEAERLVLGSLLRAPKQWKLCVLITESLCEHHPWHEVARLAIAGGCDCVQLREKSLTDADLLDRAKRLVEIAGDRADVVINDRPDIAALSGAQGVHLGQGDLPIESARRIVGERQVVGSSCSTIEHARQAVRAGADILGIGAMYPSTTKTKPEIAGLDLLRAVLDDPEAGEMPHLAIGGIDADRAHELARAGCLGVAVSSAICSSPDPAGASGRLRAAIDV